MGRAIGGSLPLAAGIAISPIPIIAVVLMLTSRKARANGPAFVLGWLLGLGIVGVIVLSLAGSAGAGEEAQMPTWMATIDKTSPLAAIGLAAALSGANPKNLLLAAGGAATIAQTGIPAGQQAVAYLVFALIGTLGVGIPVGIYFAMGERSEKLLAGLKGWMSQYNAVIMSVLCLIIGAKLIGDAISGLTG